MDKQIDFERFGKMWAAAWENCGKSVTANQLKLSFHALQDFTLEQVSRGLTKHVRDPERGMFPPKPADIVFQIQGTFGEQAMEAWGKVDQAIRGCGSWRALVFDDPVIHAVVTEMGGWMRFCSVLEKDLGYLSHDFAKRYEAWARRGVTEYIPILSGELGKTDNPILLGDPEKAQAVMEQGRAKQLQSMNAADLAKGMVTT